MKLPTGKIFLPLFVPLFLFLPFFSQAIGFQTAWAKGVNDGNMLLPAHGEMVRFIGKDINRLRSMGKPTAHKGNRNRKPSRRKAMAYGNITFNQ
jgi:hypothetical protein